MTSAAERYALIAQLAHDYNESFGRPAGKKALQKLFYVLQRRIGSANNYAFSFYNYGVYSHDLNRDLSEAGQYGFLDIEYDEANNAYSIRPGSEFDENRRFLPRFYSADRLNDVLKKSPKDLELITTIMFVCDEERVSDKKSIVDRVLELKPKFSEREVHALLIPEYCGCAG